MATAIIVETIALSPLLKSKKSFPLFLRSAQGWHMPRALLHVDIVGDGDSELSIGGALAGNAPPALYESSLR
jgi:hypothetical protein